ncbi:uncharacterized protein LOC131662277 [Vicia villosa]|uniref:uncharacterized protein LOC131662277 n=1 Tax=Vicia villosa TaxID=3911 RepID=UPI00273BFECD|nr:uncharacterized protein LOC131662277 [Vicia villosa]
MSSRGQISEYDSTRSSHGGVMAFLLLHVLLPLAFLLLHDRTLVMVMMTLKCTWAAMVIPCVVLSLFVHPTTQHHTINQIFWAFCVYLEAVSVLPQLRVMQNTKIVEPFTAHYVFALGIARFLSCAHWVLQGFGNVGSWAAQLIDEKPAVGLLLYMK